MRWQGSRDSQLQSCGFVLQGVKMGLLHVTGGQVSAQGRRLAHELSVVGAQLNHLTGAPLQVQQLRAHRRLPVLCCPQRCLHNWVYFSLNTRS